MPHSCHQLSALLTASVARGGLTPPTCPLQEEACLHSADWECPALPLWPVTSPPPTPHPFTLSLSFLSFFLFPALLFGPRPSRSLSLFTPTLHLLHSLSPALCGSLKHPQWNSGTGEAALLCGSPGSTDVNQSGFLQPFLKWAQGPRWVSAVAGPDLQLIRRKEVTFVLLVGAQFRHPKLAWEKNDSEPD